MDGLWDLKHYEKMGIAIFLFGELLSRTNKAGKVQVTYPAIQEQTGIPIRTLERWMRVLKQEGYVTVSGKNPMTIEIQNFRLIRNGRIPSNMSGQENSIPSNAAETSQNMSGPDSLTPLETYTSKPFLKDKKKRESLSLESESKPNTKADKKTNPDVTFAVRHFHDEYQHIHGIKPLINGKHSAILKKLLEGDKENENPPIEIGKLKEIITAYLSQTDNNLKEKGFPIEFLPGNINGLLLKKKQPEREFVY